MFHSIQVMLFFDHQSPNEDFFRSPGATRQMKQAETDLVI